MAQTSYGTEQAIGILGGLADSSFKHTESMIASEAIVPGRAVIRTPNYADQIQTCKANYALAVSSTALIASNSTIVTVNSVATTATVYCSSNAATMAAILVKVKALSTVSRAELVSTESGDNILSLRIWTTGATAVVTVATTLGSTQPTWTVTASLDATNIFGIAQLTQSIEGQLPDVDNSASHAANSLVNVLRRGKIFVNFETAFDPDQDTLYVRYTADTGKYIGDFGNTADSARCVSLAGLPIRVVTHLTAAGIGIVELNLP